MTERRYTEEEVRTIFERAAREDARGGSRVPATRGRTLAELRAIGEEAGIPGELIVRAARSLEAEGRPHARSYFGFPIGVGRTVELGRKLTDEEWERLVVDLRDTFEARGSIRSEGSLRQWTNGNLQALVEPGEDGDRLRLRTVRGASRQMMTAGVFLLGIALALTLAMVLSGAGGDWDAVLVLGLMGTGVFGAGAVRLPSWSATRAAQMEAIAARIADPSLPPDPSAQQEDDDGGAAPEAR